MLSTLSAPRQSFSAHAFSFFEFFLSITTTGKGIEMNDTRLKYF